MFARLKVSKKRRFNRKVAEKHQKDHLTQSSSSLLFLAGSAECCRQYHLKNWKANSHSLDPLPSPSSESYCSSLSFTDSSLSGVSFSSDSDSMASVTSSQMPTSQKHLSRTEAVSDQTLQHENVNWALVGVSETLWLEAKNGSLCLAPSFTLPFEQTTDNGKSLNIVYDEIPQAKQDIVDDVSNTITTTAVTAYNLNTHHELNVSSSPFCGSQISARQQTHQLPPTVIVFANGAFHLKDLSPFHQTRINERRVPSRAFVKLNEFDQIRFGENSPIYRFEKFITKRPSSSDSGMDSLKHNQCLSLSDEHSHKHHHHDPSTYPHHHHNQHHIHSKQPQQSPSSSSLLSSSSSQSSSTSSGNSSIHSSPSKVLKLAMQRMKRKLSRFSARSRHSSTDDSLVDGSVDITFIRYDNHQFNNYHSQTSNLPLPLAGDNIYSSHTSTPKNDCSIVLSSNRFVPVENEYDLVAPDEEDDVDAEDDDVEDDDENIVLDSLDCFELDTVNNHKNVLPDVFTQYKSNLQCNNDQTQIESSNDAQNTRQTSSLMDETSSTTTAITSTTNSEASAIISSSSSSISPSPLSSLSYPKESSDSSITIDSTFNTEVNITNTLEDRSSDEEIFCETLQNQSSEEIVQPVKDEEQFSKFTLKLLESALEIVETTTATSTTASPLPSTTAATSSITSTNLTNVCDVSRLSSSELKSEGLSQKFDLLSSSKCENSTEYKTSSYESVNTLHVSHPNTHIPTESATRTNTVISNIPECKYRHPHTNECLENKAIASSVLTTSEPTKINHKPVEEVEEISLVKQNCMKKAECDTIAVTSSVHAEAFFISFSSENDCVEQTTMLRMTKDVTGENDRTSSEQPPQSTMSTITMSERSRNSSTDLSTAPSGGMAFVISFDDENHKKSNESNSLNGQFQRQPSLPRRFTSLGRHSFSASRRTETDFGNVAMQHDDVDGGRNTSNNREQQQQHYRQDEQQQQNKAMAGIQVADSKVKKSATTSATSTTTTGSTLKRSSSARSGGHHQQQYQQTEYLGNRSHRNYGQEEANSAAKQVNKTITSSPILSRRTSTSKSEVQLTQHKTSKHRSSIVRQNMPDSNGSSTSQPGQLSESAVYLINRMLEDNSQHRACTEESDSSYNSGQFTSVHQHPMSMDYVEFATNLRDCSTVPGTTDEVDSGSILASSSFHEKQTDSAIDDDELSDTGTYTIEIDDEEHKHRRYHRSNRSSSSVTKEDQVNDEDKRSCFDSKSQLKQAQSRTVTPPVMPSRRIDSSTFERKASSQTTTPLDKTSAAKKQKHSQPVSTEEESEELVEDEDDEDVDAGDDEVDEEEEEEEEDKLEIARRKIDELFNVFENRHRTAIESAKAASPSARSGNSSGTFTRPKRRSSFSSNEAANNSTSTEDEELVSVGKSTALSRKSSSTPKSRFLQEIATPTKSVYCSQQQSQKHSQSSAVTPIKTNDISSRISHESLVLQQQHTSKIRAAYSERASSVSSFGGRSVKTPSTATKISNFNAASRNGSQQSQQQPQQQQSMPNSVHNRQMTVFGYGSTQTSIKSQSAPGTPLMSGNRKVFRSRLPNASVKSITKTGNGNCSRKSSIVSSASSMDDRYSSVDEFDDQSSVLSADTYVMPACGSTGQNDSSRSGTPAQSVSNSSMRFNRAFALRRARLGMDTCGVEISEQAAEKAKVSQQNSQPKPKPKTLVSAFNRQDGGRFSLRVTSSTSQRQPSVAAVTPTRKANQTSSSKVSVQSKPKAQFQNYMSSTVSTSGKVAKPPQIAQLSVMSSNENLTNVRHPSPRFGRRKTNSSGRSMHSDNEITGMLDGESSCDENANFSRFGRSSLRQNIPYLWSMKNNTQNKPRPQFQPMLHETSSVPSIEPIMQKSCSFGNEPSFNRASYEVLNDDSNDYNSSLDASMRHMSSFQMGKRFFSTKPHQMAQFDRDFRCSSAAPRIKLSTEPNMMTHSATESLLTRHSNTSSASSNGPHQMASLFEHRVDAVHQAPPTGPIGMISLASGTPPINANAINSRVFSISPLDSLVISAINQLSSKLRTRMQDLLERERNNESLDSETRALMEEILPRVNSDSGNDRKSTNKNSSAFTHETNNVSRDLSNILKNLKKAEQIFDVFQLLMDPVLADSNTSPPCSTVPVVEEPATSESDIMDTPIRTNHSLRKFSAPVLESESSIAQAQNNSSSTTSSRKSFFIEI